MLTGFFYRTYLKMSRRNRNLRLSVTPFGLLTSAVCLLSGLAGVNVFSSDLYKLFSLSFALLLIAYFSRDRKGKALKDISVSIFLEGRYDSGSGRKYTVRVQNKGKKEINGVEIIPVVGKNLPSADEFISIPEPDEKKRNIWDRNIYYFRWAWHLFRLHRAEFSSVNTGKVRAGESEFFEGKFRAVKRGTAELEGLYLVQKGIFGLFSCFRFIELHERFYIHPAPAELAPDIIKRIESGFSKRSGARSNTFKKFKAGDFVGLRDYVPGDPPRNIHWKTWAKRDKPAVVEKGTETVREISFLLINLSADDRNDLLFEDCVSYLYSMIRKFEADDYEVSLHFFDDKGSLISIQADREAGNFNLIYNALCEVKTFSLQKEVFVSKALSIIETSGSIVFSHETDNKVEELCSSYSLDLFTPDINLSKDRRAFGIPKINHENYRINLP